MEPNIVINGKKVDEEEVKAYFDASAREGLDKAIKLVKRCYEEVPDPSGEDELFGAFIAGWKGAMEKTIQQLEMMKSEIYKRTISSSK